jgi:hypothetical protein
MSTEAFAKIRQEARDAQAEFVRAVMKEADQGRRVRRREARSTFPLRVRAAGVASGEERANPFP